MKNSGNRLRNLSIALISLLGASSVHAQALTDRFWLQGGGYYPDVETIVQFSSANRPQVGTQISLESDLDLDKRKLLPAFYGGVRLSRNFSIAGEYYSLARSGTKTLERDLVIDDAVYPASASVSSEFNTDIYRLLLGYAFIRRDNFELGAALGVHFTHFEFQVQGRANVGDIRGETAVRRHSLLAPLPTIGLFTKLEIAPDLTIGARADYLSLTIDYYTGRLINTQADITYRFVDNVGIGLLYRYVHYRLNIDKEDWSGQVRYNFQGPAFFVEVGF